MQLITLTMAKRDKWQNKEKTCLQPRFSDELVNSIANGDQNQDSRHATAAGSIAPILDGSLPPSINETVQHMLSVNVNNAWAFNNCPAAPSQYLPLLHVSSNNCVPVSIARSDVFNEPVVFQQNDSDCEDSNSDVINEPAVFQQQDSDCEDSKSYVFTKPVVFQHLNNDYEDPNSDVLNEPVVFQHQDSDSEDSNGDVSQHEFTRSEFECNDCLFSDAVDVCSVINCKEKDFEKCHRNYSVNTNQQCLKTEQPTTIGEVDHLDTSSNMRVTQSHYEHVDQLEPQCLVNWFKLLPSQADLIAQHGSALQEINAKQILPPQENLLIAKNCRTLQEINADTIHKIAPCKIPSLSNECSTFAGVCRQRNAGYQKVIFQRREDRQFHSKLGSYCNTCSGRYRTCPTALCNPATSRADFGEMTRRDMPFCYHNSNTYSLQAQNKHPMWASSEMDITKCSNTYSLQAQNKHPKWTSSEIDNKQYAYEITDTLNQSFSYRGFSVGNGGYWSSKNEDNYRGYMPQAREGLNYICDILGDRDIMNSYVFQTCSLSNRIQKACEFDACSEVQSAEDSDEDDENIDERRNNSFTISLDDLDCITWILPASEIASDFVLNQLADEEVSKFMSNNYNEDDDYNENEEELNSYNTVRIFSTVCDRPINPVACILDGEELEHFLPIAPVSQEARDYVDWIN